MNSPEHIATEPLQHFHPIVREWFIETFGEPSPPQVAGWPSIMRGENTLLLAPTGSGKTLAAFLWAINHLFERHLNGDLLRGIGILYISPLKALNNDIARNLQGPLDGIFARAHTSGMNVRAIRTAVRTGDTPQAKRVRMLKDPPEILITTPESLYLMLTAKRARPLFSGVHYVIVDEIHSLCGNKRGVHLSLTLERLAEIAQQDFVRIGLSATQKPLDLIARFLGGNHAIRGKGGPRPVTIVDAGRKKEMDLRVISPVPDFSALPEASVWPALFQNLLDLILSHRNTLVFVNNRRLAERVAAQMNSMLAEAGTAFGLYHVPRRYIGEQHELPRTSNPPLVKAYHGSMSREAREVMEGELKEGKLRALIATSSLELGIDIGSIDLVVQLQSPKGIARGLQRIGRSGHLINATSKGRILPFSREDLVESAIVAKAMLRHEVEATVIPRDCLDVLAQQIVAMVSIEERDPDELFDMVRRSFCYETLSRDLFNGVLEMLSGRYERGALRELRARISWDKRNNLLRPLPGSSHLAISGGGTIADRGYYGVYLEDGKTKLGEIDEEFVFESRTGDAFILGTDTWRITSIDTSRMTVVPAPGEPARMPFWRGEGIGRSFELGKLMGQFRREMSNRRDDPSSLQWLQTEFPMDHDAAWNIHEYFRKQHQIAGVIPHDRLILIEGFRDEIGDPRIVVHSCFGRRVNGLLGLLFLRKLGQQSGTVPQMLYNDDGILFRCADTDQIPVDVLSDLTEGDATDTVIEEMLNSPLFGGQFRQNASRALLMSSASGKQRTPLWLQRLKAKDLLQVARNYDDFPIVIETIREVLNDILDLNHFREIVTALERGDIQVKSVITEVPSPFAASLLFDFISAYLYEWDEPKQKPGGPSLSVNRTLLGELIDLDDSPLPLREEAVEDVEAQLQFTADGYRARSAEELHEILLRLGDLTEDELRLRCDGDPRAMIETLSRDGRAVRTNVGEILRWVATENSDQYGENGPMDLPSLLNRFLKTHAAVSPEQIAERYRIPASIVSSEMEQLRAREEVTQLRGDLNHAGSTRWSYLSNLQRVQRRTISILRKEIRPSTLPVFAHFLMRWQHVTPQARLRGEDGVLRCVSQLQGLSLPAEAWERDILRSRIVSYHHNLTSPLTSTGRVLWAGAGPGRLTTFIRGGGAVFLSSEDEGKGLKEPARRILAFLREHGASFLADIRSSTNMSLASLNRGMSELLWGGFVTNDLFAEVLNVRRYQRTEDDMPTDRIEMVLPRKNSRRSEILREVRTAFRQTPGWKGRWSLVRSPSVLGAPLSTEERANAQARQLLERYGIVARELAKREAIVPWTLIVVELQRMELRGEIRRGYFVEGLSGMQFAHPDAVEMLRTATHNDGIQLLNACDPASPFGPGVPGAGGLDLSGFSRSPQNYLLLKGGAPMILFEHYGGKIWLSEESTDDLLKAGLQQLFETGLKRIHLKYLNGKRPGGAPQENIFRSVGFYRDRDQTMRFSTPA